MINETLKIPSIVLVDSNQLESLRCQNQELINEVKALRKDLQGNNRSKKRLISVKEASEMLDCSPKKIYELKERGLLTPSKASRHLKFPVEQIETFYERTA